MINLKTHITNFINTTKDTTSNIKELTRNTATFNNYFIRQMEHFNYSC